LAQIISLTKPIVHRIPFNYFYGLRPKYYDNIIEKVVAMDLARGMPLKSEDIEV
jgi:hypothetical protein